MKDLSELHIAITSRGFLAGPPAREPVQEDLESGDEAAHETSDEGLEAAKPIDLRIDTLRAWLEPLETLERVTFTGPGDPLLHPRVAYLVRVAREAGAYVTLETGATVLEGRLVHDLIEAGLDELRVRLDAWSRQGYLAYRNEDRYDDVVRKLVGFKDQKRMMLVGYPAVSLAVFEAGSGPRGRGNHRRRGQSFLERLGATRVEHLALPEEEIPAPVEPEPVEAEPVEAAPVEAAPVEAAPVEVAKGDPIEAEVVEPEPEAPVSDKPEEPVSSEPEATPEPELTPEPEATPKPEVQAATPATPAPATPTTPKYSVPYVAVDGLVYRRRPEPYARALDSEEALGSIEAAPLPELLAKSLG